MKIVKTASAWIVLGLTAAAQDLYLGSANTIVQRGDPTSGGFVVVGACGGQVNSMARDGADLLLGDVTGRLYRFEASTENLAYSFDLGNDASALALDGDELYSAGSDGSVRRYDIQSGALLGTQQAPFEVQAMLRLGRKLYVGSPFGAIFVADLPSGDFQFFGSCGGAVGAILQHEGDLVLAAPGSVYRVGLEDGLIHDAFATASALPTGLVLYQGMLLLADESGTILRLDPHDGSDLAAPLQSSFDIQAMVLNGLPAPGQAYCFGNGCPCGNDDPGAGCANSTGAGALLQAFGSASVAQDDLELLTTGLPAKAFALYYMGAGQIQLAFGDGQLCAGAGGYGNFRFNPIRKASASGSLALGPGIGWHATQHFGATGQVQAGFTWNFQIWYRDGQGSPCGSHFNLSNALALTFQP